MRSIVFLFILLTSAVRSQSPCSEITNYIPRGDEPEIIIKVKLHVIMYAPGDPRNYSPADTAVLRKQFNLINSFYQKLEAPTLLPDAEIDHLDNSRIRFEIIAYNFVYDAELWDRIAYEPASNSRFPMEMDSVAPDGKKIILRGHHLSRFKSSADVFISESEKNNGRYAIDTSYFLKEKKETHIVLESVLPDGKKKGKITYYTENNKNCSSDLFQKIAGSDSTCLHVFYTGSSTKNAAFGCGPSPFFLNVSNYTMGGEWANAQLSAHELGHCLGLSHTDTPQFDDLPKKDKFGFIECDSLEVSNNIMGYNKCRRYLSPKQIAYIHREYSLKPHRIRTTVYCDYNPEYSITINRNTTWNRAMVIGGDLIVRRGKTLTVNCMISLPEGSNIILEEGAKLVLNGNIITNNCGGSWNGLLYCRKYYGDKTRLRPVKKKKGELVLINGGRLEKTIP